MDSLAVRVLTYLADRYLPVLSDWVDTGEIAAALARAQPEIEDRCNGLQVLGLIEVSPPDEDNARPAAVITVKGLLAIGRVP